MTSFAPLSWDTAREAFSFCPLGSEWHNDAFRTGSAMLYTLYLVCLLPSFAADGQPWSVRLGWPADKKVILLHADDIGMCYEANAAAQKALERGDYRSAAVMMPCPWVNEMAEWCNKHPDVDVGLHLTLTSEWKYYRWGPLAPREKV